MRVALFARLPLILLVQINDDTAGTARLGTCSAQDPSSGLTKEGYFTENKKSSFLPYVPSVEAIIAKSHHGYFDTHSLFSATDRPAGRPALANFPPVGQALWDIWISFLSQLALRMS